MSCISLGKGIAVLESTELSVETVVFFTVLVASTGEDGGVLQLNSSTASPGTISCINNYYHYFTSHYKIDVS